MGPTNWKIIFAAALISIAYGILEIILVLSHGREPRALITAIGWAVFGVALLIFYRMNMRSGRKGQ